MKTYNLLAALILMTLTAYPQINESNKLFSLKLGESTYYFGAYISVTGQYTRVDNDDAGMTGFRAALVLENGWSAGVSANGLLYDKGLTKLAQTGSYHLNAGYGTLFIEKTFNLAQNHKLSVSVSSGMGRADYRYDKDYRDNLEWYREYIDIETFAVFEPMIEYNFGIGKNFRVGANASYRLTSPLKLKGTDEYLLRQASYGITLKYGIL